MIGIGIGLRRQRFAGGFADSYSARVLADGGTIESLSCVANASTLLQQASLLFIPSGYKAGVAYSALPNNGNGDLTWSRNSTAYRTESNGNIGSVGANVPRLSYMYGSCPSALLEPQRTNLCRDSQTLDSSGYWGYSNVIVTANSITAPDGTLTADMLTTTSTSNRFNQTIPVTASTSYTFSFWVLRGTMTDLKYSVYNISTPGNIIAPTSYYSETNSSNWVRVNITFTTPVGCTQIIIYPIRETGSIGTVYIWGAQLEVGAYATTYIPTTSATATRLADTFTRNNIYTNGIISASGGTWYVELKNNVAYVRDNGNVNINLDDSGGFNNGFLLRNGGGSARLAISKTISGSSTTLFTTTTDNVKIAIKWNGTTADVFVNGVKQVSATAFTTIALQNLITSMQVPVFIQTMALYNTPLSDANCITLTT